jgi:hypothetical protein
MRLHPLVIATTLAFAVTTPALASENSQSGFHHSRLDFGAFRMTDDNLIRDLNGYAVKAQTQYSSSWQFALMSKQAEAGSNSDQQKYRRLQLAAHYQFVRLEICQCDYLGGLELRTGEEEYQGVFEESHQFYAMGYKSEWVPAEDFALISSLGYQYDNAQAEFSRRGWYYEVQLNYQLSSRISLYADYQRQEDQHHFGVGIRVPLF